MRVFTFCRYEIEFPISSKNKLFMFEKSFKYSHRQKSYSEFVSKLGTGYIILQASLIRNLILFQFHWKESELQLY